MERFLERISFSEYRDRFVLKGGMLVAAGCPFHKRITPPPVWAAWTWFCTTKEPVLLSAIKAPCLHPSTKRKTTLNYWKRLKVLDKGIIKQLKIQGPTYDKTPPLETMGGVFVCKVRHSLTIGQLRALLDILSRGWRSPVKMAPVGISPVAASQKAQAGPSVKGAIAPPLAAVYPWRTVLAVLSTRGVAGDKVEPAN